MEGGGSHLPGARGIRAKDTAPSWGGRSMHVWSLGGEEKSLAVERARLAEANHDIVAATTREYRAGAAR